MQCSETVEHQNDPFETHSVLNRYEYLRHNVTVMAELEFIRQGINPRLYAISNPNNPDNRAKYLVDQLDQDVCLCCPHDPACQWPNAFHVPSAAIVFGHHRQVIPLLQCHVANREVKQQWVKVSIVKKNSISAYYRYVK
jgi:hypothetical protein